MTLKEWLDSRVPPAPAQLRDKIGAELGSSLDRELNQAPAILLSAGRHLLMKVVRIHPQTRADALDLLAADALVTYAFEAASEVGQPLGELARSAMTELAAPASSR